MTVTDAMKHADKLIHEIDASKMAKRQAKQAEKKAAAKAAQDAEVKHVVEIKNVQKKLAVKQKADPKNVLRASPK